MGELVGSVTVRVSLGILIGERQTEIIERERRGKKMSLKDIEFIEEYMRFAYYE